MSDSRVPFGVLISGGGTNLQALLDAAAHDDYPGRPVVVISNRRDAGGLDRARAAGVPACWLPHRGRPREEFDAELVTLLREHGAQWVAMAGFMRIVTPVFLSAFRDRVLNIHPSLLPAFPGVRAQQQAHDYGVRIAGATIHFVSPEMDTGPIILQGATAVSPDDDAEALQQRILRIEHQLYPRALALALRGQLRIEGRRVILPPDEPGWRWLAD
ncbi:MAG: phosphoribosylglycinamide formyltransferase-1 [Myxococcota bacterium]